MGNPGREGDQKFETLPQHSCIERRGWLHRGHDCQKVVFSKPGRTTACLIDKFTEELEAEDSRLIVVCSVSKVSDARCTTILTTNPDVSPLLTTA